MAVADYMFFLSRDWSYFGV